MKDNTFIRPSLLDKLALCGHYRSEQNAGPAAERGTRVDQMFRHILTELSAPYPDPKFDPEEMGAATWAAATAVRLANGNRVYAAEGACRVSIHIGLVDRPITGTMDAVCPGGAWSADLKTGQKRDYVAQQALYALGCMEQYFCEEWTVFLIYADLKYVETLRYSQDEAAEIVMNALARWKSDAAPTPNDYCGWCAKRFTCPAYRDTLGQWLAPTGLDAEPELVLADVESPKLVSFLNAARALEPWVEEARRVLKDRMYEGQERVAGAKLVPKRGTRRVDYIHLLDPITTGRVDLGEVLMAAGAMPEAKAKELWPAVPDELIFEAPGRVELHVSKPKKTLTQ